jgi:hypothetical protein
VHDPGGVSPSQTVGHLRRERENSPDRQRARRHQLAQAPSFDPLHRDVGDRAALADIVDDDDVRMVQRRGGSRLLLEAAQALYVAGKLRGQDLQRHLAAQPRVPRPVNLSHATRAERRENFVRAQPGARGE